MQDWSQQEVNAALAEIIRDFDRAVESLNDLPLSEACPLIDDLETRLAAAEDIVKIHRLEDERVAGEHGGHTWRIWLLNRGEVLADTVRAHVPLAECRSVLATSPPTTTVAVTPPTTLATPLPPCPTATPTPPPTATPTATATLRPTATPTSRPRPTATSTQRPSAIRVHESVWECFADRPNRRLTHSEDFLAGCGGWSMNVIEKWDKDRLSVYVEPQGDGQYRELAVEALEYLSPILRIDFVYDAPEREADLRVYAGVPSSWYTAIDQEAYCATAAGCGGPDRVSRYDTILQASFSVWYDPENDEGDIKHVAVHEALHALTGVDHSTDYTSMMSERSALRLPYLLPWEEEMYRLYSDPRVTPGMSADDVRELVEVVQETPMAEQGITAVEGYLRFVESNDVRFRVDVRFLGGRCDVHNYTGTVMLSGIDRYGFKHTDLSRVPSAQTNIDFDIERLLVYIARSRNAMVSQTADGVALKGAVSDFGLLDASWHTGYTVDYEVMLDSGGYVQSFRMDWRYEVIGNSCARISAAGSSFSYG